MATNLVIADDYRPVRTSLRLLLAAESDFAVVGEAEDGATALRLVEELRPAILMADLQMPGPSAIQLAAMLRERESATRVLVVTVFEEENLVAEARRAGAAGYLSKQLVAGSDLIAALRVVSEGGSYWPPDEVAARKPMPEEHMRVRP